MNITGPHAVELTTLDELHAKGQFDQHLGRGYSLTESVARVEEEFPNLDPAFYRWIRCEPLMPVVPPIDDATRAALGMKFRAAAVALTEIQATLEYLKREGHASYIEALGRLLEESYEIDEDGVWLARTEA